MNYLNLKFIFILKNKYKIIKIINKK
jgi:hypothetical protein